MEEFKKFNCLNVSSKFAICGLPLRVDTYKTCSFGCTYCFANCRKIMEFEKNLQIGNIKQLEKTLKRVYDDEIVKDNNFLDMLLQEKITWHCGGMSDPFQPIEKKLNVTRDMINLANKYENTILFSTKSDTVYNCNIRPDLHSFQLSITNIDNRKDLEPNVPDFNKRYNFYRELKDEGFKVGIRIQPFIPNVTTTDIIDAFCDADHFTIEGLKLVPQNKEHKEYLLKLLNLSSNDFTQMGLLNLKPSIRLELYKDFIDKLEYYNIPYSIADNDLHYLSKSKCCCGDALIRKSTTFNNTYMLYKYGKDYTLDNIKENLYPYNNCKCSQLFTSNRTEGCKTVEEFYDKRFDRKSSPFSPKFLYFDDKKEEI